MPKHRSALETPSLVASVIIPHWGTEKDLQELLERLCEGSAEHTSTPLEVFVVNNGQPSPLPPILKRKFPSVHWIENRHNVGFAAACNQGVLRAQSDWLLFLNPDCSLSIADIGSLVLYATHNRLAATSPLHSSRNYHQPLFSPLATIIEYSPFHRFFQPQTFARQTTLPGGSLLIKKSVLLQLGGWDERFFLWFEDSDLSLRLANAGYSFAVCPDVTVTHQGGASFSLLEDVDRRQLFFGALVQAVTKHFNGIGRLLIIRLAYRQGAQRLLPQDSQLTASIVVPNLSMERAQTFLQKNLRHFDLSTQEIIIVSGDEDIITLKTQFPEVIFIFEPNRGFAHAVNTGWQRARGSWLGTVNDDTVLSPNWIEIVIKKAEKKTGSIAPLVLTPTGEVESAGIAVLPQGKAKVYQEVPPRMNQLDANNAAAVLYRREALAAVGFFNEAFGSYLEDIELGLRLKHAGWQHQVVSGVHITHFGQQTSRTFGEYKAWHDAKNWWRIMLTQFGWQHWQRYWRMILVERGRNISGFLKTLWRIDTEHTQFPPATKS